MSQAVSRRPLTAEALVRSHVSVRLVVDKAALGPVFVQGLRFSPFNVTRQMLHTHLHLHYALTRRANSRSRRTFQNSVIFRKLRRFGYINTFSLTEGDP
jgi:hypothetical protein